MIDWVLNKCLYWPHFLLFTEKIKEIMKATQKSQYHNLNGF